MPFDQPLDSAVLDIDNKNRANLLAWRGQFSPQFVQAIIESYAHQKEIENILKFTLFEFQILYKTKEHFKDNGNVINYLNIINTKLFEEGQLNKLK